MSLPHMLTELAQPLERSRRQQHMSQRQEGQQPLCARQRCRLTILANLVAVVIVAACALPSIMLSYPFASAIVTLTCNTPNTVPDTADTYQLIGCGSGTSTTITVSTGSSSRTIEIQAAAAATTPCYLRGVVVQGTQSNLIVNLKGVAMTCISASCFSMSGGTLSVVTVSADSFVSTAPATITNSFSATGNSLVALSDASSLYLRFDNSAIVCGGHAIAVSGPLNGFTLLLSASTVNAGAYSFLSAASTVSNVDIEFNSLNTGSTTQITSTQYMFAFASTVTAPFKLYSGPGTTFVGQATTTRFLAFITASDVSNVGVSISSSSLQFTTTTDPLISAGGSLVALTLSIYGSSSSVNTKGNLLATAIDLRDSTVALTYGSSSVVSGAQLNIAASISTVTASFASTVAMTAGTFVVASAITGLTATCSSITTSTSFIETTGPNANTGLILSATSCGTTGQFVKTAASSSLVASTISFVSTSMVNNAQTAFMFQGSVATTTFTISSSPVISAGKFMAFGGSATSVSITCTSSTAVVVTASAISFESTSAASSTVLISASSSSFTGPTFMSMAYNVQSVSIQLDSNAAILATSTVITTSSSGVVNTLSIVGGTGTTISSQSSAFKLGQVSFFGLALTGTGATFTQTGASLPVFSISASGAKAVDFTVSVAAGASLRSTDSTLFSVSGLEATDFRLSVVGGSVTLGQFVSISTSTAATSNYILTTSSNAVVSFSSMLFASQVAVTNAAIILGSGTTISATNGLMSFTMNSITHQSISFTAISLSGTSTLNSATASLISSTSSISSFSVSLNGAMTLSTTSVMFSVWIINVGAITATNSVTLISPSQVISSTGVTSTTVSMSSSSAMTSTASHIITVSTANTFSFIGSASTMTAALSVLRCSSTAASVVVSIAGCTFTSTTSTLLAGAIQFDNSATNVQITFLSASTISVPSASLIYFGGILDGTNVFSMGGASTITVPSSPLITCTSGFQGTSMSLLISSSTITAANRLLGAQMTATSQGSVISIISSTITIRTTDTTLSPSLIAINNGPQMNGVMWTVSSCGITHLIPTITPTNDIFLSIFAVVGASISITNSIGPSYEIYATSVTSMSSFLSTFVGLRFDGTGLSQGHNNPQGTIIMEQLTYTVSTTKVGLVYTGPNFVMRYMNMTFQCIDIPTTSLPPVNLLGLADQVYFNLYGVQIHQTLAQIAAIDASNNAGNQYLKFRFLNSLIHTPKIIGIYPSLLVANPTPPQVAEIYAGCSRPSEGYDMSAWSFGSPLYTAFQAISCDVNKYKNCLDTTTRSRSASDTASATPDDTETPTDSLTKSLSSDPTKTYQRTWTNYSYSNSSELTMSKSLSMVPSTTFSSSEDPSTSKSVSMSPSLTLSQTSTGTESQTPSSTQEQTPSDTVTGTVTESRGSKTKTESMTPMESATDSTSPTESPSYSMSPSSTQEVSFSPSPSKELSLSKSQTATSSQSSSQSDEKSRSRSRSASESPSGVTPSPMASASPSDSFSKELTLTFSPTAQQTNTYTDSPSWSVTESSTVSDSGSRSGGTRTPTVSRSVSLSDGTLTNDESRSNSPSFSGSVSATLTPTVSQTPSVSDATLSNEPTRSVSPTPSETPSVTEEISRSTTPSQSSSSTLSDSVTLSQSTESSRTTTLSQSITLSLTPSNEASRSVTLSQEKSNSRLTSSITPTFSTTEEVSASRSLSMTVTLTDVTLTDEKSLTTTNTLSNSRSDITSDLTLTATMTVSPTYSAGSASKEQSLSSSRSDSVSAEQPSGTRTMTYSMSSSGTFTLTQTESITAGSFSDEQTFTGNTRNITPSGQTLTLSESPSANSRSLLVTISHTKATPSKTDGSLSAQVSMTSSNTSSPTEERTKKSESKSPNTPTHTVTTSDSSDVTLTVTRTITPPRTLTDTKSITPGKPGPLSNLQQAINFFDNFLSNGQSCTAGIWYVIGILLILFVLEAFVILCFKLLGGVYEKHPETVDGVGVIRSLVVRSTYLGVFWPCHYRCALPHTAIAILHITLVMAVFYVAAVRLYLSSDSPVSLRVIVALGSAVAPHLITNPLRQLLFYYTFNTNKLEKAWLKYCEITGRHQSREYYPTVKAHDPLQVVLDMSKSKVDPHDANVSHHRHRHAIESDWRKKVDEDDTFEFDMNMPGAAAITAKKPKAPRGAVAVQIMDEAPARKKRKNKVERDAEEVFGGGDVFSNSTNEAPAEVQAASEPIIRVMSVRRLPGALSPVSPSFKRPTSDDDDDDEAPQITVVTDSHTPKKKKKGKKNKKGGKKNNASGTPQASKGAPSPVSLLGVGEFVDSDSDISIDVDSASPSPAAKLTKKRQQKPPTGSKAGPQSKYSSDEDFTIDVSSKGGSQGGRGGDGIGSEIGSIDINAIFGSALFGGSTTTGGGSKPSSSGKPNPEDLSGYVPSIVISVPPEHPGSFIDMHNLDLDFSELGADDDVISGDDQRPNTKGGLGIAQRDVLKAFATPRGAPSISSTSDGRLTAAIFDDVDSIDGDGDGHSVRAPDFPSERNTPMSIGSVGKHKKGRKNAPSATAPEPKQGSTAFKLLHGIEDPFQVTDSEDSSDDDATKRFKKASAPSDLFNENDPFGFSNAVRPSTSDSAGVGGSSRRGSQSFKLHPLKDSTVAVVEGAINNKVVQHNLEDRWERRSDEWSLPSASDSTDTDGDDEEGREYFPAPIIVYNFRVVLLTALIFVAVCFALFFMIRGVEQPGQLCITDLLYVTFLVDFFAVEFACALLVLMYRIWWYNEDGSHERPKERRSWRTAIRQCDCTLHPFTGELKEHLIPPLRKGKKRFVRDQPYEFGVPVKHQPTMVTPKPQPVEPKKTRLPKWEEY